jgi:hypothetical protein
MSNGNILTHFLNYKLRNNDQPETSEFLRDEAVGFSQRSLWDVKCCQGVVLPFLQVRGFLQVYNQLATRQSLSY